jgi:ABC-type branched-subunit amino acid transport system permease subunit
VQARKECLDFLSSPLSASFLATKAVMTASSFLFLLTGILVLRCSGRILAILTTAISWFWVVPLSRFLLLDWREVIRHLDKLVILGQQMGGRAVLLDFALDKEFSLLLKASLVSSLVVFVITWWFFTRPKVKEQFNKKGDHI